MVLSRAVQIGAGWPYSEKVGCARLAGGIFVQNVLRSLLK